MIKILYLEDDINLADTIADFLEDEGFNVTCVHDAQEALDTLYEKNFDILLLDVNVPVLDGFKLLQHLRSANIMTPTIFITALKSIEDLDEGYKSGCDDYLKKPFELKELLLRINALVKRRYNMQTTKINLDEHIVYDLYTKELVCQGESVSLRAMEQKLLSYFVENRNNILSVESILNELWSASEEGSEASLRVYIRNLRKKVGQDKIINIKKQGYKFVF